MCALPSSQALIPEALNCARIVRGIDHNQSFTRCTCSRREFLSSDGFGTSKFSVVPVIGVSTY